MKLYIVVCVAGNLWIANVEAEDFTLKTYYCNIHNPALGLIRNGKARHLVSPGTTGKSFTELTSNNLYVAL